MRAPNYSAQDYLGAMQALMPRGRAWPRDLSTVQARVLQGLAPTYAAQTARSNYLLVDAFPTTTNELLPEWEATLGLPSPAAGPNPTIAARQLLVAARFIGVGGLSRAAFIRYSGLLGFTVTITAGAPFRCGQSHCGQTLGTNEQMYAWTVQTSASTATAFGAYGQAVLQYELQRVALPYSVVQFKFT